MHILNGSLHLDIGELLKNASGILKTFGFTFIHVINDGI